MCKPQKINKLDVSLFLQLLLQQVYWKHCQNISAATLTISLLKTAIQDNHSSLEQKKWSFDINLGYYILQAY